VYLGQAHYDYCLMELKSIIKANKFGVMATKAEIYSMMGDIYLKLGRDDEALQQYLLLEKDYPEEYNIVVNLGKILTHKKEYEKAIGYYNKALKLKGTDPEAIAGLGICYYHLGDFEKTKEYLDQAVQLDRKNYLAHYYYGLFYHKKQLYDTAIGEYEKAMPDKSLRMKTLYGMGMCYQQKEVNVRAIDTYEQAIQIAEQTAEKIRDYLKREACLKEPLVIEIRYHLAEAYYFDKNFASAIEQWQEIESALPDYKDVKQRLKDNARFGKDRIQDFIIFKEMDFEKVTRYMVDYLGYAVKELKMKDKEEIHIKAQGTSPDVFQGITLIHVKRSFNPVGERDVAVLLDSMNKKEIKKGLMISAKGFAPTAIRFGLDKPIDFVGKHQVMRLLKKYEHRI
ncbi:MAG: tetratricopeptide repeat protein, partial [Spirochaetes bacterium]|nr:tetratricopeptide repeat protein [Spirochaetota bacterium]